MNVPMPRLLIAVHLSIDAMTHLFAAARRAFLPPPLVCRTGTTSTQPLSAPVNKAASNGEMARKG